MPKKIVLENYARHQKILHLDSKLAIAREEEIVKDNRNHAASLIQRTYKRHKLKYFRRVSRFSFILTYYQTNNSISNSNSSNSSNSNSSSSSSNGGSTTSNS